MKTVMEYLSHTKMETLRKRIVCKDGFSISVQATKYAYCYPRVTGSDYYEEVECGFPSAAPEGILEYAENPDNYTETVYGYVPIHKVERLVESHSGIDFDKTLQQY
jgi:hypothetical protein